VILFHWIQSLWWPETGKGYALGSSWAGDTGLFGVWGLLYLNWKRHNCHEAGCLRVGRHTIVAGDAHELYCRKHAARRRHQ